MNIYPPRLLVGDFMSTRIWSEYPVITSSLEFINKLIGSPQLLIKIADSFKDDFHYLSPGQAKAIIKRKLRFSLSSGERNDLSRLRKKFEGYRKMIRSFEHLVDKKPEIDAFILPEEEGGFTIRSISDVDFNLKFVCMKCGVYVKYPDSTDPIIPPEHHGKPMMLNWGISLSPKESTEGTLEISDDIVQESNGIAIDGFSPRFLDDTFSRRFLDDVAKELISRTKEIITIAHAIKVTGENKELVEIAGSIVDELEGFDLENNSQSSILNTVIKQGRRLAHMQKMFLLEDPSPEKLTTFIKFNLKMTNLNKLSNII